LGKGAGKLVPHACTKRVLNALLKTINH